MHYFRYKGINRDFQKLLLDIKIIREYVIRTPFLRKQKNGKVYRSTGTGKGMGQKRLVFSYVRE